MAPPPECGTGLARGSRRSSPFQAGNVIRPDGALRSGGPGTAHWPAEPPRIAWPAAAVCPRKGIQLRQ
jgi:hypothetical protein